MDGKYGQPLQEPMTRLRLCFLAGLGLLGIFVGVWALSAARSELEVTRTHLGTTPVTVYQAPGGEPAPAVLIAHGFAGSQQLMAPFAVSLANAGYVAVTYDLLGHGRNGSPLTGDVTSETGAMRNLLTEMRAVADYALDLPGVDGRLALLGHSMASDVVVRYAADHQQEVSATIAVSLFSRAVTAEVPKNLLVIVGAWEPGLKQEGLRVLRLGNRDAAKEGETVGDPAVGTARRLVFADAVEHIGVLYSRESLVESVAWLNGVFGRSAVGSLDTRGPWLALLFAGIVLLAYPLSHLLPRAAPERLGANLGWKPLALLMLGPAILTPLVLRVLPTDFLPLLVADYLAAHFALYGLLTAAGLAVSGRLRRSPAARPDSPWAMTAFAAGLVALYGLGAIGLALDGFVLSFAPTEARLPLIAVMIAGTLPYFMADEWLTRGEGARPGAYPLSKLCFALSLAAAVALDLRGLFFLIIIIPLILIFFVVYGLFSRWAYRATAQPLVAGLANALAFAWAIAVTFPILGG
ncbi:alpha/beta hydrolase [Algihabitans albus]|uniref:alpha/beta hydrolase n=1 Tax=Algihabitans albus TaxID=2164067 RepID=UPI001ABBE9ED|nr:alpha/beta fold hydrolase [Algihabitans albus]